MNYSSPKSVRNLKKTDSLGTLTKTKKLDEKLTPSSNIRKSGSVINGSNSKQDKKEKESLSIKYDKVRGANVVIFDPKYDPLDHKHEKIDIELKNKQTVAKFTTKTTRNFLPSELEKFSIYDLSRPDSDISSILYTIDPQRFLHLFSPEIGSERHSLIPIKPEESPFLTPRASERSSFRSSFTAKSKQTPSESKESSVGRSLSSISHSCSRKLNAILFKNKSISPLIEDSNAKELLMNKRCCAKTPSIYITPSPCSLPLSLDPDRRRNNMATPRTPQKSAFTKTHYSKLPQKTTNTTVQHFHNQFQYNNANGLLNVSSNKLKEFKAINTQDLFKVNHRSNSSNNIQHEKTHPLHIFQKFNILFYKNLNYVQDLLDLVNSQENKEKIASGLSKMGKTIDQEEIKQKEIRRVKPNAGYANLIDFNQKYYQKSQYLNKLDPEKQNPGLEKIIFKYKSQDENGDATKIPLRLKLKNFFANVAEIEKAEINEIIAKTPKKTQKKKVEKAASLPRLKNKKMGTIASNPSSPERKKGLEGTKLFNLPLSPQLQSLFFKGAMQHLNLLSPGPRKQTLSPESEKRRASKRNPRYMRSTRQLKPEKNIEKPKKDIENKNEEHQDKKTEHDWELKMLQEDVKKAAKMGNLNFGMLGSLRGTKKEMGFHGLDKNDGRFCHDESPDIKTILKSKIDPNDKYYKMSQKMLKNDQNFIKVYRKNAVAVESFQKRLMSKCAVPKSNESSADRVNGKFKNSTERIKADLFCSSILFKKNKYKP
jgi:hypothetical protein